ncbi:MAG: TIGR00730 family Rossman fold protein [Pseudomonadota bacterium]
MKVICVYCGSRDGDDLVFARAAEAVGAGIAARGMGLVYGAGDVGLMGRTATATLAGGGPVVGVIPHHLKDAEIDKDGLTELIAVDTMHERKMIMFKRADAFVALPGGPGTLDELIELLTWRQLGLHEKPAHLLNLDGYWDPLIALLRNTVDRGFASESFLGYLAVHETPEALLDAL